MVWLLYRRLVWNRRGIDPRESGTTSAPDISLTTIERTLHDLLTQGMIEKVGAGRSTGYVWKG